MQLKSHRLFTKLPAQSSQVHLLAVSGILDSIAVKRDTQSRHLPSLGVLGECFPTKFEKVKKLRHVFLYSEQVQRQQKTILQLSAQSPLNGSEAGGDLVLIQTSLLLFCKSSCSEANGLHLHEKSSEVWINARTTPASVPFKR